MLVFWLMVVLYSLMALAPMAHRRGKDNGTCR
jgi:hypothetical protein